MRFRVAAPNGDQVASHQLQTGGAEAQGAGVVINPRLGGQARVGSAAHRFSVERQHLARDRMGIDGDLVRFVNAIRGVRDIARLWERLASLGRARAIHGAATLSAVPTKSPAIQNGTRLELIVSPPN